MDRRAFIGSVVGGLLAVPIACEAQGLPNKRQTPVYKHAGLLRRPRPRTNTALFEPDGNNDAAREVINWQQWSEA